MLLELRIENLLLIERAELRFDAGLNAITGETGAGKTVLAHSLDLLMGGRARSHIVLPGAEEAYVEGVFALPDGLLAEPELADLADRLPESADEIVLGRRVGASGRTSAFVQGRAATAADLRALAGRLLAFYGQHEHRRLSLTSAQLEVLDGFAGPDQLERRASYRDAHGDAVALERELADLHEHAGSRERDLDLLRYELSEIDAVEPDADEEAELAAERGRLRHAEGLREAAVDGLGALAGTSDDDGGAAASVAGAESTLAGMSELDPGLEAIRERVAAAAVDLGDAASELRTYLEAIDAEPGRLEQVEERLAAVERLKRKHGGSVESVLEHAARCRAGIERLETGEETAADLEARLAVAATARAGLAAELSAARAEAARELEKRIGAELSELAMERATLEVALESLADDGGFGSTGADSVEFLVAINPGLPASPLREVASGGELSRLMLALAGLAPGGGAGTMVLDEIDAGVGGATARSVGERLRRLAEGRQVICITHLPQVASRADAHFRVEKRVAGDEARASVERVDGEDLVAEIVRMLGADHGDEAASRHARDLLQAA